MSLAERYETKEDAYQAGWLQATLRAESRLELGLPLVPIQARPIRLDFKDNILTAHYADGSTWQSVGEADTTD